MPSKYYKWDSGMLYFRESSDGVWIALSPQETILYLKQCLREVAQDFYENDAGECCSDIKSKGVLRMIGEN